MKRAAPLFSLMIIFLLSLAGCTGAPTADSGTTLKTEVVDVPPAGDSSGDTPLHDLFAASPGTLVSLSALTGTVDPVGTTLTDDFDGDGLTNDAETTTNVWVADYPVIGTSITTPVTMRIEILYNNETSTKTLATDIMSEETESTKDKASDQIHRHEAYLRTVQYQDAYNKSNTASGSIGTAYYKGRFGASINMAAIGGTRTASKRATSVSVSHANAYGETKTKWKDQPFKNDVNASGWVQKDNDKSKKAKQIRSEYREISDTSKKIKPNAGYVRAALYITNNTVNLPVRLYEIYCSLMLENSEGTLLPVANFLLKKDDYSPFELNLYGGTTFGPYVIELERLNTQEIRDAIAKGYNPRIFLIDYKMGHVPDSNYRTALSSRFNGDNLKIIEENAKGRTAGIKLVYPGERQFFRVAAFDTDGVESRTGSQGATAFAPGVSLEKALTRITYSGLDVQYADIVFDTRGMEPEMSIPRFHVRTIKSINGVEMRLPFPVVDSVPYRTIQGTHVDENGNPLGGSSTAYLMKPMDDWTPEEAKQFRAWAIFENGRYYLHTKDILSAGEVPTYFEYQLPGQETVRVPMVEGIQSMIWPGDHYDIVCLEHQELEEELPAQPSETKPFGANPFESGAAIKFNTRWNLDTIGPYPFQPDAGSAYLGEAILGDVIEFTVKLNQTRYLNPAFGDPELVDGKRIYQAFSYDLERPVVSRKFEIDEAVDFEISFGLGGQYTHWTNLTDPLLRSPSSIYPLDTSDRNWNYLDQEFTIRVPIPLDLDGVGPDRTVKVFIRPARNTAYRESVWPLPHTKVKQFRGTLLNPVETGASHIDVTNVVGKALVDDTLYLDGYGYAVSAVASQEATVVLTLSTPLQSAPAIGTEVYINLKTPYTEPLLQLEADTGFEAAWNQDYPDATTDNGDAYKPLALIDQDSDSPINYLGYSHNLMETNWLGYQTYANPYWNQWADGSTFKPFLKPYHPPVLKTLSGASLSTEYSQFSGSLFKRGTELAVSSTHAGDQIHAQLAIAHSKALVVWQSNDSSGDYDIMGQVLDLTEGQAGHPLGTEISVSSHNFRDQKSVQVAIADDKALVVWHSLENGTDWDIKGQVIDLAAGQEGALVGSEFLISETMPNNQFDPQVAISGTKAFVAWVSYTDGHHNNIMGRVINLAAGNEGQPFSPELLVSRLETGDQNTPRVCASTDRAMVIWQHQVGEGNHDIKGQVFSLASGAEGDFLGAEITINTSTARDQVAPHLSLSQDKALVVWESFDNGLNWQIRGQIINLAPGMEGKPLHGELAINTTSNRDQGAPQSTLVGERALVVWHSHDNGSDWDIKGRLLTLSAEAADPLIGPEITVADQTDHQSHPTAVMIGDNALVLYQSAEAGTDYDTKGQVVNLRPGHEGKRIGSPIPVSTHNIGAQVHQQLAVIGDRALAIWSSLDNGVDHDIKGQLLDVGWLLNDEHYFKAPLLERDYEVKAKILEE